MQGKVDSNEENGLCCSLSEIVWSFASTEISFIGEVSVVNLPGKPHQPFSITKFRFDPVFVRLL